MKRYLNVKSGPLAWLLYLLVRSIISAMQVFPIDTNLRAARALARLWGRFIPTHRERAITHLRAAYGASLPFTEIERLADRCLESTVMFAVEVLCLPRLITASTWPRYVNLVGFEEVLAELIRGRGCLLVTGHYGSFELSGHVMAALGFDVTAVMRPLDNPYLNRWLVRTRRTRGLELLDKKGASAQAEAVLDRGGLLGFIGDQDAGRKGVFVDFFGMPASTYKSIGLLALTTERPIVVGGARRIGDRARFEFVVERIIRPDEWAGQADPLRWVTQEYTAALERMIRAEPGQYLWIHRRWKSRPGERRRARRDARPQESISRGEL